MKTIEKYNEIKTAYLSSLKTLSQSVATYDKYEGVLNDFGNFLEQNYAETEQPDISPIMVLAYKEELNMRGVCRNTMHHYLIILRSFFKWCVQHKFYTDQPIFNEDIPKQDQIKYDLLTETEVNKILSGELPPYTHHPKRIRAIIFVFLLTGLRVSELINLRVGDLNLIKGSVTIIGKGNKQRTSTLPQPLIEVLQDYLTTYHKQNKKELLFSSIDKNGNPKPYTRQNITKIVEGYVNRLLDHRHIGAHDLRHAFASMLITQNAPLAHISSVLGHSSWETTKIYAEHLCPTKIISEVNSIFDNLPIFSNR